MLEALKSLFETNAISEEIRAEIESAWNKKVEENKLAVTADLRSEFAEKYEHDKANLTDAVDKICLLYTSPSPRDHQPSRMPSSA